MCLKTFFKHTNQKKPMYINVHSYYSLRYGTMAVEEVVETAKKLGIGRLALTDINNSSGIIDFVSECTKQGIDPVAGIEFRDSDRLLYLGIARNGAGFRELNDFLTCHNLKKTDRKSVV